MLDDMEHINEDSEDEFDWEEVEVPELEQQHLEITIEASSSRQKIDKDNKKKGISHAERLIRIDCHKIHTIALLGNGWVRNQWINDPLLHARLLSLTPLTLQNAFGMIHKSRIPDQNQRGRMFEGAVANLVEWWSSTFFEVTLDGHIRNRTYDAVQSKLIARGLISEGAGSLLGLDEHQDFFGPNEIIRSPKSLMKHTLMRSGSRDTSAQLFTALCRALGIPARLVVSLQSVPWQTSVGKPKPNYVKKPKTKEKGVSEGSGDDIEVISDVESVRFSDEKGKGKAFPGNGQQLDEGAVSPKGNKAKGKEKAKPVIKLRKTKSKGNVLGSYSEASRSASSSRLASPDPVNTPPVFWTEVFSRPDARWLPVDPIRCIVNKRKVFDPSPASIIPAAQPGSVLYSHPYAAVPRKRVSTREMRQENRMVYVVAFEEDGYARDVTRRYAKEFSTKIAKVQGGSNTIGKGRQAWWKRVMGTVSRPYRLHRDDVEDEELEAAQMTEGMPTTIGGFKDHPLYVLVRHLKQTEVIHPAPPDTKELGKFRGEPVYPRSSVVSLKTAENWMRSEGRTIKEGCQALKFVKVRAGTVGRMRELEVLKDELREAGGPTTGSNGKFLDSEVMQGLYARNQTEPYIPDPVVNGKVPKNNFGNIDLYVPSMLPRGAVHIPFKGIAKIARKLGFDYAEAVTGFEFKKRRAFPIIQGVVIAAENEAALLEAYWEAEQDAEEKARIKQQERIIKRWTRLIHGLRVRQRIQEQYVSKPERGQESNESQGNMLPSAKDTMSGGGFIVGADDVVQAFHLPKYHHYNLSELTTPPLLLKDANIATQTETQESPGHFTYDLHTVDIDSDVDIEEVSALPTASRVAPKTMREMAEDAAQLRSDGRGDSNSDQIVDVDVHYSPSLIQTSGGNETSQIGTTPPSKVKAQISSKNRASAKQAPRARSSKRTTAKRKNSSSEDNLTSDGGDQSPPKKRIRSKPTFPAPTASTRVLRSRIPKTLAQLNDEKEQEDAYKRAVAR